MVYSIQLQLDGSMHPGAHSLLWEQKPLFRTLLFTERTSPPQN